MIHSGFRTLPFVGRRKEISLLKGQLNDALNNRGSCALITGEAGIGKSRLINEFITQVKKDALILKLPPGVRVSSARELISAMIRAFLQSSSHSAKIITKVVDEQMYNEFSQTIPELSIYYPFEARITDDVGLRPALKEYFFKFVSNIAALSPAVIIVEDLHEVTDDVFDVFGHLLQNIGVMPVIMILTTRPNLKVKQWGDRSLSVNDKMLFLDGLEKESVHQLNNLLFQDSIHESFLSWLYDKTKGMPLFLHEFIFSLVEKGVIFYDNEQKQWRTIDSYVQISIPGEIPEIIRSKFMNLSREETKFVETAAVIGINFDPSMPLLKMAKSLLPSLLKTGLVVKNEGGYSFSHPLIRDILYEHIPENVRLNIHHLLADFYLKRGNKELAADHLLVAGVKSIKLLDLLVEVGQDLQKKGDYACSLRYVEQALAIARSKKNISQKRMFEILLSVSKNLFICEKYEQFYDLSDLILGAFNKHRRLIEDARMAYYYNQLTQAMIFLGKFHDALNVVQRALKIFRDSQCASTKEKQVELEITRVSVLRSLGNIDKALALALEIEHKYGETTVPHLRYNIYRILGSIYHAKQDYRSAIPFRKQALSIAEESGVERVIAGMKGNLGVSLALSGKLKEGIEYVRQCQHYDLRAGRIRDEIVCYLHIAEFSFDQGFLPQADSEYKRAINRCRQFGRLREVIFELQYQYSKFLVITGRYEEARQYLENAIKAAEELNVPALRLQALLNKGIFCVAMKNKTGLDKLLEKIKADFKDIYKKEIDFPILEGFNAIFGKKTHNGIMKIEAALNELEGGQALPSLFMLLYFCAQMLKGDKATSTQADKYLEKAINLAEQYQMTGWLKLLKPDSIKTVTEPLRITCFGSLRVEHPVKGLIHDEQWQRVKPKQLLSILISGVLTNMRLSREKIGALLWPELSGSKMISNFHVCLYQSKALIGKEHVKYGGGYYMLDNVWIDACEFKQLVNDAQMLLQDGKVHMAESKYQKAIYLYQGGFLEDIYDPWIDEIRKEMASLYRNSLFQLGDIYIKKFKFDQATNVGRCVLNSDPFDEEGHRFLIRSYAASGEKAKAINQYKICAELFKKELNCLPSEETQELYNKIIG